RNHHQKAMHQMAPVAPKIQKRCLQSVACPDSVAWVIIKSEITNGATPPPNRPDIQTAPWPKPRSVKGNQLDCALAILGKAPASPTPNRKRTSSKAPIAIQG